MNKSKNQVSSQERNLADIKYKITNIFYDEVKPRSFLDFVEALQKHKVLVHPNLAKNGHISGCSFEFEGISFKGSEIGYSWSRLIASGIRYNAQDAYKLRILIDPERQKSIAASHQDIDTKQLHSNELTDESHLIEVQQLIQQLETLKSEIESAKAEKALANAKVAEIWQTFHNKKDQIKVCQNHLSTLRSKLNNIQQEIHSLNVKRQILGFGDISIQQDTLDENLETLSLDLIAQQTHNALLASGNVYSLDLIKDFTALLAVNDFVVLAGNPGNGKTSLCREYARVTGSVCHVIPVKPNWTSSDDLLGFYSPIEKQYIKTPFLNALLEASHDPNRLHLICLDEINLARPEYYFADFLSVLEIRSKHRSIEINVPKQEPFNQRLLRNVITALPNNISIDTPVEDILSNELIKTRLFKILNVQTKEEFHQALSDLRNVHEQSFEVTGEITIPNNVCFIGTMNVDETTNFFAPKILDRAHIIRLGNPIFTKHNEQVPSNCITEFHVSAKSFGVIEQYPVYNENSPLAVTLKKLAENIFLPLHIDLSMRTIRQALLYEEKATSVGINEKMILGNIIRHKLLPKCVFEVETAGDHTIQQLQKLSSEWADLLPEPCLNEIQQLISMGHKTHTINWWLA